MGIASIKKQYIAVSGITFEGLKGKPHVEPGDLLPVGTKEETIIDLLDCGDIKEVKEDADELA